MTTGLVGGVTHFSVGGTDITSQLATGGGELGGYLTARDQDIPNAQAALDQLSFAISTEVNAQNKAGVDLNGNPGTNIFFQPTNVGGAASTMAVTMTDPNLVAAGAVGQGSGDNSNAQAMANLANEADPPILTGLTLPNDTPSNFFSAFVTNLGSTISQVQTENTAQNASVSQLQTQNNSLTAVNLNDEASAMTTMERSYQSASQVFTILDTLMNSVLNLGTPTTVS
jgi:flagellar hook-associated protein 1 FlgK